MPVDVTDKYIHIRVKSSSQCDKVRTKTISKKGILARICIKDGKSSIQSYMFKKSKGWTKSKAKKWVSSHNAIIILMESYNCQCVNCGYTTTSEKHCNELKCPKCGGKMRRKERPGPGR